MIDRREFLNRTGAGFGSLALSSLLGQDRLLAGGAKSFQGPHQTQQIKSVIWLFINGGPSGIDLFDHKPALDRWHGTPYPGEIETLFPYPGPIMRSPFKFKRYGDSGTTVSEVFPNLAKHVDDLTFLKACVSDAQNHAPACYMVNSGVMRVGAPCVGSWVSYGLGSENQDLPAFIVMYDHRSAPEGAANLWDAGFLPGNHQGVTFRTKGDPILYLKRARWMSAPRQRRQLDVLRDLNELHVQRRLENQQLQARIESFETAFRMQVQVPNILDVSSETEATHRLYGLDVKECKHFGGQLLLARRLVEKGVRFIQVYHGGYEDNWDQHGGLAEGHRRLSFETDRPIAGLLADLKQRGLLDSTLVVWGGEFGRLPISQDRDGRDHNPFGFTMWLAGGGLKKGFHHGKTDEFGHRPIENPVHVHDLHATILHLLGLDHSRLTYYHDGREQSLTNNLGGVVRDILA